MSIELAGAAKARELREYFSRHGRIYIVVNATSDEVQVPEHLHGDPALRLVLNVRMPQHIHINDEVLESDLTFSGSPYHCVIPMHAVWAAYMPEQQLENGILWEEDVPETIRAVVKAVRGMGDEMPGGADVPEHADGGLAIVPGQSGKEDSADQTDKHKDNPSAAGRRLGHLRVVK